MCFIASLYLSSSGKSGILFVVVIYILFYFYSIILVLRFLINGYTIIIINWIRRTVMMMMHCQMCLLSLRRLEMMKIRLFVRAKDIVSPGSEILFSRI